MLEDLEIESLGNITRFGAIISNQQLRELTIISCEKIEVLIAFESGDKGEEVTGNKIFTFTQLRKIKLGNLPNLRRLFFTCDSGDKKEKENDAHHLHALFNKAWFPSLETLEIDGLSLITVIWDKQLLSIPTEASQDQLCILGKLRDLRVSGSCNLKYLFSPSIARCLGQLHELKVQDCESMEAIIGDDKEEVTDNITFNELKNLELLNLPKLKSFYADTKKMSCTDTNLSTTNAKVLFPVFERLNITRRNNMTTICKDQSVRMGVKASDARSVPSAWFPSLEKLLIGGLDLITVIWDKQLLSIPTEASQDQLCSLGKLRDLRVSRSCKLKYLFSSSIARCLGQLHELTISHCESMESIIGDDKEEVTDSITFDELKRLELRYLPKLKSFYANMKKMSSSDTNLSTTNAKVSFPMLEILKIESLGCIARFGVVISNQQLQELTIISCEKIEELIALESVDKGEEVTDDKILTFTQLQRIQLGNLPNLQRLFFSCDSEDKQEKENDALINKVSFPMLEVLKIENLDSITRFGAVISNQQLQELTIISCEKIEELIAFESGGKGEEVTDNKIFTFTQLLKIELGNLPNLRRLFFTCDLEDKQEKENDAHHLHALFNKVSFPVLRKLDIYGLKCIEAFNRLHSVKNGLRYSFPQLEKLFVGNCENMEMIVDNGMEARGGEANENDMLLFPQLKNMRLEDLPNLKSFWGNCASKNQETVEAFFMFNPNVSFPVLRNLGIYGLKCITTINRLHSVQNGLRDSFPQLELLDVKHCKNMEMIVAVEMEGIGGEANEHDMLLFPQLKNMRLEDLPNLKSFWGSCASKNQETVEKAFFKFNKKVKTPHFEELYIKGVDNLKEIWHSTVPMDSVFKLKKLIVRDCANLLNVGPLKLLGSVVQSLEKLEIMKCPSLKDVFKIEASNAAVEDERVEKDEGVRADMESSVVFHKLRSLGLQSFDSLPPLARGKDSFPVLFELSVSDERMFEDIREGRHVPFLGKVRVLTLEECSQLVNVGWVLLLRRFEAVERLNLTSCSSLQVVFNLQGLDDDATERLATASSQVKTLRLKELPKLEHVWMMGYYPKGPVVFSNLTSLRIECCNKLRYLFSLSTARALTQLKYLYIEDCEGMEEIVVKEDGEENIADEIEFSQLFSLFLRNLPKLTSFCEANNVFHFPSLKYVEIRGCPKLYTFTCGVTRMPNVYVRSDFDATSDFDDSRMYTSDINEYVRATVCP